MCVDFSEDLFLEYLKLREKLNDRINRIFNRAQPKEKHHLYEAVSNKRILKCSFEI